MAKCAYFLLSPWEAENCIKSLEIHPFEDIGTESWFQRHKKMILLNQQSIFEVSNMHEESIKEWFITYDKIPILIFESIQMNVWNEKIFPLLIEINGEPSNTFLLYSAFYQENLAISLLESILFHSESVASINDSVIDLIDYVIENVTNLLYAKKGNVSKAETESNSCFDELMEKKEEFQLDIQLKSVSILRYLAEFIDELPLSAVSRMLRIHDVPYLFAQLIENKPWKKVLNGEEHYFDGKWQKIEPTERDKVVKIEAQIWIGIREFLLNPLCASYYEVTQFRKSQFLKLQKYLHEQILDQISPLIDLRRWLCYLNVSPQTSNHQTPVIVEIVPEMKLSIIEKYHKRWKNIAKHQSKFFFTNDIEHIKTKAQILSDVYDIEKFDLVTEKKCEFCKETAKKRCSKCKITWYCKRECQVKDWTNHKELCEKIQSLNQKEKPDN